MRLEATERSYSWTSVTGREQMNMRGMNEKKGCVYEQKRRARRGKKGRK